MKLTVFTQVRNDGTLTSAKTIRNAIDTYRGKTLAITFDEPKKVRSNEQNAYFHGVVIPLVTERINDLGTFITQSKVKDMLKAEFLLYEIEINGDSIKMVKGTSELSTKEFKDFVENIQIWAADVLDLVVPDPNEQIKIDL